jgi:hypothetical protein
MNDVIKDLTVLYALVEYYLLLYQIITKAPFVLIIIKQHRDGNICDIQGLWPWGFFSQVFTPKFWRSVKLDGLVQTYQRGHKAVMNTHSVGGLSTRTHYVGMDQYGNKYYEDFSPLST